MSIAILAQGALNANPQSRTSGSGKSFVTASLLVATEDEPILVSIITFDTEAQAALMALRKGDQLAATGRAKMSRWTGKDGAPRTGLSLTATRVISLYEVQAARRKFDEGKVANDDL